MADPKIRIKRSAVAGKIPTADQVPLGEIALNTYDGKLFASRNVGIGTTVFVVNPWTVGTGTNTYNTYFTSGNVGIGSTLPDSQLDVSGNAKFTGIVTSIDGRLISGIGINTAGGNIGYGITSLDFRGSGISTITVSSGIATINFVSSAGAATTQTPGRTVTSYTTTAGINTYNVTYEVGYLDVFLNGIRLDSTEYTATTGTNIILNQGPSNGDSLDLIYYTLGIGNTGPQGTNGIDATPYWVQTDVGIHTLSSVGIGTTNPTSQLFVLGNANFIGIVTASSFSGNATSATYAINAGYATTSGISTNSDFATYASLAGVSTYSTLSGISTYATTAGIATYSTTAGIATYATTAGVATDAINATYAAVAGIATYAEIAGISTYAATAGIANYATTAGIATDAIKLQTSRTFEITGDVLATAVSFDGTGNVSFAATIQPNSVALGSDTTGDYVQTITGTSNQITVTGGTGEGSTPTLSFPNQVTIPQDLTVLRDVQIDRNLNVTGNITIGGTSATLFTETLKITDSDLVLGFRTDAFGNDVSNDTTANHGGIAVASTEGNPLVNLNIVGIETLPPTYKKIMWFKAGEFAGLGTDAWIANYAVGIGSTQFPTGTRLAAGSVQFTENDLAVVRNINASGVGTIPILSGTNATYTSAAVTNLNITGVATATSFIKSGGTSTQFLKADGSVDSNTYITGVGIQSGGTVIGYGITTLNFVGTGNTFAVSGTRVDISISGSGGGGGSSSQWTTTNVGIHTLGSVGIGTTNPTSRLTVSGNALIVGVLTATDFNSSSDLKLKNNISPIENPLDKVVQINGVEFTWKENGKKSAGVIAQEVEKVLPNLVNGDDVKTVNYNGLIGLLIEVVKDQQKQIDDINHKLKSLGINI